LPVLEEGEHNVTLKVWDNYNNSSSSSLTFKVNDDHGIGLRNFNAWPNPVKQGEEVYFSFRTDAPNALMNVTIQFIDGSGKVTGEITDEVVAAGNQVGPVRLPMSHSGWNHSGICYVRVMLEGQNGQTTSEVIKLFPAP
jgi:hypothetical protein